MSCWCLCRKQSYFVTLERRNNSQMHSLLIHLSDVLVRQKTRAIVSFFVNLLQSKNFQVIWFVHLVACYVQGSMNLWNQRLSVIAGVRWRICLLPFGWSPSKRRPVLCWIYWNRWRQTLSVLLTVWVVLNSSEVFFFFIFKPCNSLIFVVLTN